jgi:FtsP/CotA-like multicopper oxidase with cupredoxin domain
MTVNGKAYPNLNVEQNVYRVRILNACNSRGLTISFLQESTKRLLNFTLYKSDSCYHYQPIQMNSLALPVAGRAEIVIDFTKVTSGRVIMRNVETPNRYEKDSTPPLPTFPKTINIEGLRSISSSSISFRNGRTFESEKEEKSSNEVVKDKPESST